MSDRRPILVTGACGFVGASLCATLVRSGEEVIALDDLSTGSPANWAEDVRDDIELVHCDIRDTELVAALIADRQPKTVYHLAAIHFIPACDADPSRAISINVAGTQSVLCAAMHASEVPALVLASTGAVYAPSLTPHAEDSELAPTDIYGLTKLWMEQAAELHRKRTGARIAVARLFNVVGAGETNPHLVPEIIEQARRSQTLRLGNLTTRRDYIDVADVADGLIALADVVIPDEIVTCNLGAESPVDGYELVRLLGEVLELTLEIETDESKLRVSDRPLLESNCNRAHRVLGWSAQRPLISALRAAVEDARRHEPAASAQL
ncbi:MAG TPA: NAD(P)-dependent oxidoreductase [Solirubrobacteraceae bacterium]|nr:NAD(P)-dependent oxidoreductase [Solirubrobacteraceae bacterium]